MKSHRFVAGRRGALAFCLGMFVLAVGLAGCGGTGGQPDALAVASVNGHAISLADYQTVLGVYKALGEQQGQVLDWQTPAGRTNLTSVEQQSLDFLINLELMREHLKAPISAKDLAASRASLTTERAQFAQQGPSGVALMQALSPRAIELFAEQNVTQNALLQQVQVPTYSARGILVKTRATAQSLENQVFGGAEFGQLAHANSLDTTSAAQNGQLGTVYPGQFNAEFDADAFGTGPSKTHGSAKYVIISYSGQYALFELTQFKNVPLKSITDSTTQQNAFNWWLTSSVRPHASVEENLLVG